MKETPMELRPVTSADAGAGDAAGGGGVTGERALILMPTGRDAALVGGALHKAGVSSMACRDIGQMCVEMHSGAGVMLVAEEALGDHALRCLLEELARQPTWSE